MAAAALVLGSLALAVPGDASAAQGTKGPKDPDKHHKGHKHQRWSCQVAVTAAASAVPREAPNFRLARAAVCLINERRAARGLRKLRLNKRLSRAARRHTRDMVRHRYFSHVSRGGKDVVDRLYGTGYLGGRFSWTVGENIAWGAGGRGTPRKIVKAWMNSPGHRQNMLSPRFRDIGIGVAARGPTRTGGPAGTYTTTFGARR
jgi:uncharacterized protein YkwD